MSEPTLTTKAQYDELGPLQQGYAQYMEGDWPGSELKDLQNPYPAGSSRWAEWNTGQLRAAIAAQDSEE